MTINNIPEKTDVLHVAGYDAYDRTHESGNYIVFNALRNLNHDSHMVIHQGKSFKDDKTFILDIRNKSPEQIANELPNHKVLIMYGEDYTPEQIKAIYNKHKCNIIRVLMTHDFLSGGCAYPAAPDLVKVKYDPRHPDGTYSGNSWFLDGSIKLPKEMYSDPRNIACDGYIKNCGNCPQLNSNIENDKSRQIFEAKKKYLSDLPIIVAGVSNFSLSIVKNSSLFKDKKTKLLPIPNDIPYCSSSKQELREQYGFPTDLKIILWGTTQPHNLRKGLYLANEALNHIWHRCTTEEKKNIAVLNVGPRPPIPLQNTQRFNTIRTDYVQSRQGMAQIYKMSDIALCTTISDAGPMMVSESMRNECPVVAFDRSVALDIITNGENGYIINGINTVEMADRALELLRSSNLEEISKKCPAGVEKHHNFDRITKKWDTVISELIQDYDLNIKKVIQSDIL